ncbi:MAG TPA: hypothetical protein VJA94_12195 [Candidatus Angelobacter sp.]
MQTELIIEAQIRKREDGTVGVLGECGHVIFGGLYADLVWTDYQRQLARFRAQPNPESGKLEIRVLLEVEAMEPY